MENFHSNPQVKAAEVTRQRADKSERLRIKREAYSNTRKQQELEVRESTVLLVGISD